MNRNAQYEQGCTVQAKLIFTTSEDVQCMRVDYQTFVRGGGGGVSILKYFLINELLFFLINSFLLVLHIPACAAHSLCKVLLRTKTQETRVSFRLINAQ